MRYNTLVSNTHPHPRGITMYFPGNYPSPWREVKFKYCSGGRVFVYVENPITTEYAGFMGKSAQEARERAITILTQEQEQGV